MGNRKKIGTGSKTKSKASTDSKVDVVAARREADEQLERRELRAIQSKQLRELEAVRGMLDNLDHPVWWAIALVLSDHVPVGENESLHAGIVRIVREHADAVRAAFDSARAPYIVPLMDHLAGKKAAEPGESDYDVFVRVLMQRGASSYEAVRVAGGYGERVHSAGLPEKQTRAARRLGERLREQAAKTHAELVKVDIPHAPLLVGSPTAPLEQGLLAVLDDAVRREEKQQAEIVRNIDKDRRKKKRG